MIIIEEEWSSANLANRAEQLIIKLRNEIKILKTSSNRQQTIVGNEQLKTLTEDFQQLVQTARRAMTGSSISPNIRIIANKIEYKWKNEIYPLIKEYDDCVYEYNKRNDKKLQYISKRTGDKINSSIKTIFFDY